MQFNMVPLLSATYFNNNIQKQSNQQNKIYHKVNSKSSFIIYLLECYICNIQYVGKSETSFNIRLNNHRKNVKNPSTILACKYGKFITIEQLRNIRTTSTETLKERLKQRENFWIMKLKTLAPHGLNEDLNWIYFMQTFRSLPFFVVAALCSKITDISREMTSNILQHL